MAELQDVFLYTVDDLERAIEDNRRSRREAAAEAEAIIDLQVERFIETSRASTRTAPLKRLRAHGESAKAEVLAKARQQLASRPGPGGSARLPRPHADQPTAARADRGAARGRADRRRRPGARRRQAVPLRTKAATYEAAVASGGYSAGLPMRPGRQRTSLPDARSMTPSLRRKLEALAERREEVERLLADPGVIGDDDRFRKLSREFAQLEPVATALAAEAQAKRDLAAAEAMRADPELRELAEEEIAAASARLERTRSRAACCS